MTNRQPGRGRRYDVVRLSREGLGHKEIAALLGISMHSVKYHISKVYRARNLFGTADRIKFLMGHDSEGTIYSSLDG